MVTTPDGWRLCTERGVDLNDSETSLVIEWEEIDGERTASVSEVAEETHTRAFLGEVLSSDGSEEYSLWLSDADYNGDTETAFEEVLDDIVSEMNARV